MKKILMIFLFGILLLTGCYHVTDQGQKIGTVIKLSQSGMFIKTWEAEMIKGGMNGGSGAFGVNPFFFTVRDKSLLSAVQDSFNNQKEVIINYHKEMNCPFDSDAENDEGSCYYVDSIKELPAK